MQANTRLTAIGNNLQVGFANLSQGLFAIFELEKDSVSFLDHNRQQNDTIICELVNVNELLYGITRKLMYTVEGLTCVKRAVPEIVAGVMLLLTGVASADPPPYVTVTNLHSFANAADSNGSFVHAEGGHPRAALLEGSDGKLYGTTWLDGVNMGVTTDHNSCGDKTNVCPGSIFKLDREGGNFAVIHSFAQLDSNGRNNDGYQPATPLVQGSDGYLYGVSSLGGQPATSSTAKGCGVAFKLGTDGTNFSVLHNFGSCSRYSDGCNPYGALVPSGDGYFYGSASAGASTGRGIIYKMAKDGSSLTNLHSFASFTTSTAPKVNSEGAQPYSSPILSGSTLYGMTVYGGANGRGTIYSLDTSGTTFTNLHDFGSYTFTGNTDNSPLQNLIKGSDGNFYGAHEFGGTNGTGVVFKFTSDGTYTVLHEFGAISANGTPRFSNADGALPLGTLVEGSDGHLYGTTSSGGANGTGAIYQVKRDGSAFVLLYSFSAGSTNPDDHGANADGTLPYAGLMRSSGGTFYGTTYTGGATGFGTVYKMTPPLSIPSVTGAAPNTLVTSQTIKVSLLNGNNISITNGEYSLNGGAFSSSAGNVYTGDTLTVRTTSSSSANTRVLATVTLGNRKSAFGVTTAP